MKLSRRDLTKLIAAAPISAAFAPAGFAKINSRIEGVMVGAQTYSFRDRDLDACIAAMKDIGLGYAELWQGHLEPSDRSDRKHDAELKKAWRANPPMDQIDAVKQKFDEAGIEIYALNYSFRTNMTDDEIRTGFLIAQNLGTNRITASANVDTSAKIDPFAEQYKTYVGMHNHDSMRPNEFSTPDDFANAMKGRSKYIKINLDIGHFTAAGFDPVQFIEQHHDDILTTHIKDRKSDHGPNMPFGQGDTRIKEVLQLLKARKYPIPANIEYEYGKQGMDSADEVRKCFEYMKQALS
jgi:sugar phosphate isomerase/epimerase